MKQLASQLSIFLLLTVLISCNNSSQPTATTPPQVTNAFKRYHLKGKVVSVDQKAHMLNVDGEAIPGFMPAMTMPYNVKPETELDKLSPGDSITADVVVQEDNAWLEKVAVTGHSGSK